MEKEMTDEQRVKAVWPDAWVHSWDVSSVTYYSCCSSNMSHREIGKGKTPTEAWSDAASRLPSSAAPKDETGNAGLIIGMKRALRAMQNCDGDLDFAIFVVKKDIEALSAPPNGGTE